MKITSLILVGYRGFKLRQINYFEYHPTAKTQAILGTNGSGKSSMLCELSPLPATVADFDHGGRKEIEMDHCGKHYHLQSLFEPDGNRFVFMVDGENLNPGYTVTVYKELVKEHFGYTAEIHALLTGDTTFHAMSVNDRRNWTMRLSDTDYTYAVKYYQRLKDRVNGLQGALKRSNENLAKETVKCLTPRDEDVLRQTITELNVILDQLLAYRKPRLPSTSAKFKTTEQLDIRLKSDMARLAQLLDDYQDVLAIMDLEGLERQQITLQAQCQTIQHEIARRCELIEKTQKDLDAALAISKTSLSDVQTTLRNLDGELNDLYPRLHLPVCCTDPGLSLSAFDTVWDQLVHVVNGLSVLPRLNYTRAEYLAAQDRLPIQTKAVLANKAQSDALFRQIQLYEESKAKGSVECPKCTHRWVPNYDENQYLNTKRRHEQSLTEGGALELQKRTTETLLEEHREFTALMASYDQLTRHFEVLAPFWTYLQSTGKLLTAPMELLPIFQTFSTDLRIGVQIFQLTKQYDETKKLEALMLDTRQVDVGKLQQVIDIETAAVTKAQEAFRTTQEALGQVKALIATRVTLDRLNASIQSDYALRTTEYQTLLDDQCTGALDELIRSVKLTVNAHERSLSQVEVQKGIVTTLSTQIAEIKEELALLKKAQKALSPVEGLIARGMTLFINHFIAEVNRFIERIWLYPLEILPLTVTDDDAIDLDYKFRVRINNDHVSPDIAKTSKGMREVIDLAFVATSMVHLGLSDFPVFLDEFAVSLDVAHRQSAYRAIDHLIESTDYSQVFLVSHYQNGYTSLHDSEVLVLCDSNVELPGHLTYNQHVTMY